MRRCAAAFALALLASATAAQPLTPMPAAPDARLLQAPGTQLPLELPFVDSAGRSVRLGDFFGQRPVLLVLGYYRCPQLCGLLMHGLIEALHEGGVAPESFRLLRVSIDPDETPSDAQRSLKTDLAYAAFVDQQSGRGEPLDLHLLTGSPGPIDTLARRAGWQYRRDGQAGRQRYAHPAVAIVVTPDGRISRYFPGVRFDARDLRLALVQAGHSRIGGLSERIALLCAHFDPTWGRHSEAVLDATRALGVGLVLLLIGWWWRSQRHKDTR